MSENKVCKTTITADGVTLEFINGQTLVCSISALPTDTITQAALFGIRRKVTNSFADAKGNVDDAVKWNGSRPGGAAPLGLTSTAGTPTPSHPAPGS